MLVCGGIGLATTSFRDELKLLSPSAFGAITGIPKPTLHVVLL